MEPYVSGSAGVAVAAVASGDALTGVVALLGTALSVDLGAADFANMPKGFWIAATSEDVAVASFDGLVSAREAAAPAVGCSGVVGLASTAG